MSAVDTRRDHADGGLPIDDPEEMGHVDLLGRWGAGFLHPLRVLGLVAAQQLAKRERQLQGWPGVQLAARDLKPAKVGIGRFLKSFTIDEAQALLEPIEARSGLPLGNPPEHVLTKLARPAEDDAIAAAIPLFQRCHASVAPRNSMRGDQRRDGNVATSCSRILTHNAKEEMRLLPQLLYSTRLIPSWGTRIRT